ncbi:MULTISPECIES: oxidative damage protection protein [Cysteiniphilum]|uniref:Probable Fe(2+)-trafficking protein n=1 Tax=Cysteiniphilum litorale TaxID=2056700 RepID=A0A8J2Z2X6_9GAMM|nr:MULTISPECIES: oxidative damage protection protein [Cysteiniphilum]WHN65545.1 oxidative damage protection protein [Cysteiniphilum sp. QT6929]GGF90774.1 putative Fe(2+)-trafficking protein [Cysteiniphilum litorale]
MTDIFCEKLKQQGTAMQYAPIPGELGQRIFKSISQEAWSKWLDHQTILINEYRLNLLEPEAKKFLMTEMEKFLFGEGSEKPDAFSTPE